MLLAVKALCEAILDFIYFSLYNNIMEVGKVEDSF
jgi:hypothetical protein